ncbi:gluconate 2-dehydrogenase subunit 3 family protein [Flectobacillus sp. DC10W]|uniref:Gluconate 2-dehydrogenase subunit 3 family protein n=1 Tax=Flectobacillus longus TaxID=2984207 RepID=A0ABT6YU84_9BACT|nr:gluconate 2-dehydrogenase subunit 3 family protein [Flectobacillus longus]MDI9867141.1 gluconate 2-dehydrogenase subunit 3 family protein [Flectobacillus longus]
MKRRSAIKNLSMAVGAAIAWPSWAQAWTPESLSQTTQSTHAGSLDLLGEVVETIIPETTTPGAKSLKVHVLVDRMIRDCYGSEAQQTYAQGLNLCNEFSEKMNQKPFSQASKTEREKVLKEMSVSDNLVAKSFVALVKGLTIRGYMNSEYVMTNILHFNMAPGYYHGCVPVK